MTDPKDSVCPECGNWDDQPGWPGNHNPDCPTRVNRWTVEGDAAIWTDSTGRAWSIEPDELAWHLWPEMTGRGGDEAHDALLQLIAAANEETR